MSATGLADNAVTELRQNRKELPPRESKQHAASINSALSALASYIPAEAMAIYLAVASSLDAITMAYPSFKPQWVYWGFVFIISPGLFLLAYFTKLAKENSPLPELKQFPWFRIGSSMIAFAVWGLCVPGNPMVSSAKGAGVLFGILAMFLSVVLPSAEAIWNWYRDQRDPRHDKGQGKNS